MVFIEITHLIPKGISQSGKDFRTITCMSNLYKLTTKCVTAVMQLIGTKDIGFRQSNEYSEKGVEAME